jgi:hypothetical protein
MKPDLYTKAVLTVIAFMLVMIGCRQYISPTTTVKAERAFSNLSFSANNGPYIFFDTRTGELWEYTGLDSGSGAGVLRAKFKMAQIGQRLIREK